MLPNGCFRGGFLVLLVNPRHLCCRFTADCLICNDTEYKLENFLLGLTENDASVQCLLIRSKFSQDRLPEASPVSVEIDLQLYNPEAEKEGNPFSASLSPSYTLTHTRSIDKDTHSHPSAMRQGGPNRINSFGPAIKWKLLNFQKLLSKCLHCTPVRIYASHKHPHTHTHTHLHHMLQLWSADRVCADLHPRMEDNPPTRCRE